MQPNKNEPLDDNTPTSPSGLTGDAQYSQPSMNSQTTAEHEETAVYAQSQVVQEQSTASPRPVGGLTIQPLSPEADIRSEVQASRPTQPPQTSGASQDNLTTSIVAQSGESPETNAYASNTKPHFPATTPYSQPLSPTSQPNGGTGKKIVTIFIALFIIVALGAGAYFLFGSKLVPVSLATATVQKTSYKYPEGWSATPVGLGAQTYSNVNENKPTLASVTVDEYGGMTYTGNDRPDNWYEVLRSDVTSKETAESLRAFFSNKSKDCTSDITFAAKPDTKAANKTIGMTAAEGKCTREDGTYVVKRRIVVGEDDGIFRRITVAATESEWSQNEATYQAILDSVGQSGS